MDPTTNTQGPLGADSTLRALQSRLLNDVTYSITGNGGVVNLAALGIDLNNDGTLSVNQVATDTHPALSDVLAKNPSAVQSFFENGSGTGFANTFNNDLFSLTDTTDGIVNLDIAGNKTYAYDIQEDGTLKNKRLFCSLGSDGMTIDSEGNVYLTGKGVTVFDKAGKQIEKIAVPEPWTANVCFSGKERDTLFITASKAFYSIKMRVKGVGSQ